MQTKSDTDEIDPDAQLTRRQTIKALDDRGFPIKESTLATMATRGGGPPFQKWGRWPLYRWETSHRWALDRLSPVLGSTAEADHQHA